MVVRSSLWICYSSKSKTSPLELKLVSELNVTEKNGFCLVKVWSFIIDGDSQEKEDDKEMSSYGDGGHEENEERGRLEVF